MRDGTHSLKSLSLSGTSLGLVAEEPLSGTAVDSWAKLKLPKTEKPSVGKGFPAKAHPRTSRYKESAASRSKLRWGKRFRKQLSIQAPTGTVHDPSPGSECLTGRVIRCYQSCYHSPQKPAQIRMKEEQSEAVKLLTYMEKWRSIRSCRRTHNPKVEGSNPSPATNLRFLPH